MNYGDLDLVLCEVDTGRLASVAAQFRISETRTDYRDMLARDGLDAVLVLTPPAATYGIAKDCLSAGLPTLMEKPPGMTTDCVAFLPSACTNSTVTRA